AAPGNPVLEGQIRCVVDALRLLERCAHDEASATRGCCGPSERVVLLQDYRARARRVSLERRGHASAAAADDRDVRVDPMLGHEASLVSNAGRRQLTVRPSWGPAAHAAAGPNRRLPLASPGARNPRARSYGQACGAPGIFLGAAEVPLGERSEFLWAWVTAHSYWTRS